MRGIDAHVPVSAGKKFHFLRGKIMLRRTWSACAMLALLFGGTTAAQQPGTLEVGGFGQWTWFDDHAGRCTTGDPCLDAVAKDGFGYGGRLGVFLTPNWQIEGDGYYSPQDRELTEQFCCTAVRPTEVNASAFALRLNYNVPLGLMGRQSQFIIGGGAVRTNYKFEGGQPAESIHNYGGSGLVGLRIGIANRIALRLDGVVDYMPNHEPHANMNLHARAGVSFLLGGASRVVPEPPAVCTWNSSILASDPNCRAPAPPVAPVTPPPARCVYDNSILATDMNCRAPVAIDSTAITAPIYFDFDKSDIRPDAAATLDRKIPWLQANPGMRIRIEGNADNRGSDEYNLALGQRRAAAAKRYLVEHGIDAARFDLVSYGEESPVCSETPMTEACHQLNRRDDFRIVTVGGDGRIRTP
jgi:peptidoglycan-associated lipoprotein